VRRAPRTDSPALAHLVVDEVVEEPAGVRQDLAGGLLIVWPQRVLDRVTRTAARR
jgi:hypothetical protein